MKRKFSNNNLDNVRLYVSSKIEKNLSYTSHFTAIISSLSLPLFSLLEIVGLLFFSSINSTSNSYFFTTSHISRIEFNFQFYRPWRTHFQLLIRRITQTLLLFFFFFYAFHGSPNDENYRISLKRKGSRRLLLHLMQFREPEEWP